MLLALLLFGCSGAVKTVAAVQEPTAVIEEPDTIPDDQVLIDDTGDGPEAARRPSPGPDLESDTIEPPPAATNPSAAAPEAEAPAPVAASFLQLNRAEKFMEPDRDGPPAPCDGLDRIVYYSRGSEGICGPVTRISVGADGAVSLEKSSPDGQEGGGCFEPMKANKIIEPGRARSLLSDACREYNQTYRSKISVGCEKSSRRFYFFSGNQKIFETMALPCESDAMATAEKAMAALIEEFD